MQVVTTDKAPAPAGPYSQGIIDNGQVFVSGQVGVNPETGDVVSEDIAAQTEQTLDNIDAILEAAGTSIDNAIKTSAYLVDIEKFEAFNDAYGDYLTQPYPARVTVEVGDLVPPFKVELEMIASLD
jgi:2-iminobutanoate/2-iminopropanoate deaminase